MAELFESTTIGNMQLSNRMARSATWEGMCDERGKPTDRLNNCYRHLARGGVGLIISGYTFVREDGKQMMGMMGMHSDALEKEMRELTSTVHSEGCKIAAQLVHAGGQVKPSLGRPHPIAPSAIKTDIYEVTPTELSIGEIKKIVSSFGEAAARAKAFGFDAVQLHAAHAYLISQFLSPYFNQRTDEYGGDIMGRTRFLMEIYRCVRAVVGEDYPILVKLNGSDFLDKGLTEGGALFTAKYLDREGIDAIEVSGGTGASGKKIPTRTKIYSPDLEAYHLDQARKIKESVSCKVMTVGGFRSIEVVRNALQSGATDFISLSRPLIREPHLPNRWKSGDLVPATCRSCNGCFVPGMKEGGIYCVKDRKKSA